MASTSILNPIDSEIQQNNLNGADPDGTTPPKNKGGRPRKHPLKPGEVPRTRTPAKARLDDDLDIQIFFATSTDDEWSRRMVYVWRYQPITHAKTGGKPTSCGQFASKFDFNDVLKLYGSGHYRFDVVEFPASGNGKGQRIKQGYSTIIDMKYPPKIGLGDWTEDPRNDAWKWAIPMIQAEADEAEGELIDDDEEEFQESEADQASKLLDTIKKGVEMFRPNDGAQDKIATQIVALVKDQQDKMQALLDPTRQFTAMKNMIDLVAPKQDNTLVEILREQLSQSRTEMAEMRREIREMNNKPLIAQIRELVPAIQELAPMFGFGGRGRASEGTSWSDVALGVADKLSPVLTAIVERSGQPAPPPPTQFQPAPAAPAATGPHGSTPQPHAAPNPARPTPPAATGQPLPPNVTAEQVQAEEARLNAIVRKHGALFTSVSSQLIDAYQHEGGYELRDWLCDRKGKELWLSIKADIEIPARFVALTQMHPLLRAQLRPEPKLFKFAEEFLTNFGEEDLEPEEPTGAQPHAA